MRLACTFRPPLPGDFYFFPPEKTRPTLRKYANNANTAASISSRNYKVRSFRDGTVVRKKEGRRREINSMLHAGYMDQWNLLFSLVEWEKNESSAGEILAGKSETEAILCRYFRERQKSMVKNDTGFHLVPDGHA